MMRWLIPFILVNICNCGAVYSQHIRSSSTPKEIKQFLKERKADRVVFSKAHNDVYQLRNKKTQKWGMYDWYNQLIPIEYDTIMPFNQFQQYTLAKKNNEYVIIQWPYDTEELAITSIIDFEELDIATVIDNDVSYRYFLLASQNGSWGCIDWQDLSIIIPFEYASSGEVPITKITSGSTN